MALELQSIQTSIELAEGGKGTDQFDDDGRVKRTGTVLTASAHIITAVIGSGVLSLAWAMAQLGWAAGLSALTAFPLIAWFCSTLQADCYRSPNGNRNYNYMNAVKTNLGGLNFQICGFIQHMVLVGIAIGYTITASTSMAAVERSNCFHKNGHEVTCPESLNKYMIIFASMGTVMSQIPNFHKTWWLSIVAAVTSFAYSFIGLGLAISKIADEGAARTALTGAEVGVDVSGSDKIWRSFQAFGNVAVAYSFSLVLIEIQDTLKSSPPENKVMKKASLLGVATTTTFYLLCSVCGYVAFGNKAPGNFLTGFGVYEPFWLLNIGNICIVIHLVGAFQVFSQPLFQLVENWSREHWPNHGFFTAEHNMKLPLVGDYPINYFRVVWRTTYIVMTTVVAMIFPFFNSFLGLLGSMSFWPLTVYFPVEMYIAQAKLQKFSTAWIGLRLLSFFCMVVTLVAACGSIQGLVTDLRSFKPFKF